MRLRVVLVALVAATAVAPATASAAVRYAAAAGSGSACSQVAPCSVTVAIQNASHNDTVQLAPDEYNLAGARIDVNANNLTIQGPSTVGDPSSFIPYLMFGADPGGATGGYRLVFFGTNPVLKNLAITGQGTNALVNANPNAQLSLDRVIVNYSDPFGGPPSSGIAVAGDNATITNSVIRNEAGGSLSRALEATGTLIGSLVYASNGRAISIDGGYHNAGSCTLSARNTIAWGAGKNLWLEGASPCLTVTINSDYSWIPLSAGAQTGGGLGLGTGTTVNNIGPNNLPDLPAAVDPGNPGATILPPNSPAINAGCTAGCGTHDYYGRPRPIGSANDIGPYEATLIPEIADGSASNVTAATAQLSAVVNPNGGQTTYNFQIRRAGTSDWETVYGEVLPANTNSFVPVNAEANLLQPETDYQVRIVAVNSAGELAADGVAFRTLAAPTPRRSISVTSVKARVSSKGAYVSSRVSVSGAGKISQRATTGSGSRTKTWCRARATFSAAGTKALKCNLGSKGRKALRRGTLKLTLRTGFTPTGSSTVYANRTLTIKRKR